MLKSILGATIAIILVGSLLAPICDVDDGENTLNVVVLAGQSNAAYSFNEVRCDPTVINEEFGKPSTNCYYYGTQNEPLVYGSSYTNPFYDGTFNGYNFYNMYNGTWKIGGYEPVLGYELGKKTNCDIYVINVAIGGAPINFLIPSEDGGEYAQKAINAALDRIPSNYTVNKLGFIWIQGESDQTTDVDDYIADFTTIFEFYQDLGFDKCYMVETRPDNSGNATEAQLKICDENPNVILSSVAPATFTTANGFLSTDNLHYTQAGRIVVGEDIVEHIDAKLIPRSMPTEMFSAIVILMIVAIVVTLTYTVFHRNRD